MRRRAVQLAVQNGQPRLRTCAIAIVSTLECVDDSLFAVGCHGKDRAAPNLTAVRRPAARARPVERAPHGDEAPLRLNAIRKAFKAIENALVTGRARLEDAPASNAIAARAGAASSGVRRAVQLAIQREQGRRRIAAVGLPSEAVQ